MPPFGHSLQRLVLRLLLGRRPRDVDLQLGGHRLRILAGLGGALAEPVPQHGDLVVRRPHGDDPVRVLAGALRVHRPGGRHQDRHRLLRDGVEPRGFEREVLAVVLHHLAAEELADDLDGLEHHGAADADLRPLAADDVLIQRLAGAQPQPDPTGVHGAQRARRVGDDGGVVAESRAGHRRPEGQRGPLPQRAHEAPGEGRLPLLRGPRMEVLADLEAGAEPGRLRLLRPVEQVGRMELLEHAGVTDLRHARSLQPTDD